MFTSDLSYQSMVHYYFPKYFGVPNFETYPNNPSIIGKWPLDSPENQKSSKSTSVGRGPSKLATLMPQASLHPNNQATKCCNWWCFGFLLPSNYITLVFNKTFLPSYNMEANQTSGNHWKKRRQPSHHLGSTPAPHWQRQWQHSCRAYPTWSVKISAAHLGFPSRLWAWKNQLSSFAHQLRHDGIWGVLIQCLVEFTGWSWHYLSTKVSPPGHLAP